MPAFRFNAKRVFLTYPRSGDTTCEQLATFLTRDRGASWHCVALEQHEDGGNHLHAYAEWVERLDVRDERHFDLDGLHPNIQSVRNRTHVLKYIQKGGDYIGNCEATSSTTTKYGDIVANSTGPVDFLANVLSQYPRDAVLNYERLQYFANTRWGDTTAEYVPEFTEFCTPPALTEWTAQNLEVIYTLPYPP